MDGVLKVNKYRKILEGVELTSSKRQIHKSIKFKGNIFKFVKKEIKKHLYNGRRTK